MSGRIAHQQANAQQLLDALDALHANMLAQDLENQSARPTEEEYLVCMRNADAAIRANSTGQGPQYSDVHEDYEWCDTTASMPLGAA